jgi:hypothetical protein
MAMSFTQLNPPLPVNTPKGEALAHAVIDYGPEYSLVWVCIQDNGQIWSWNNTQVRGMKNITMGRISPELPQEKLR